MPTPPINWVEELFHEAVDLPPADRASLLDRRCAGDPALRSAVEALLRHDDGPGSSGGGGGTAGHEPDGRPGTGSAADRFVGPVARMFRSGEGLAGVPDPPPPARIGPYRVRHKIGDGGMGTVYAAEQDSPRRAVAVKVLRHGWGSRAAVRRFDHEAELLGRLQHPGIAQIFEAGVAPASGEGGAALPDSPLPYFAMELVDGRPLTAYARERGLDAAGRLRLVALVCDAVQHAHDRGVIHRDLKPANILVTPDGRPKVLDFGVARAAAAAADPAAAQTEAGHLVGTPAYMSPEQFGADPAAVDRRTDVYALGVLLYELLAGRPPYDLRGLPLADVARAVRERAPARLGSVAPRLRGDVETVVATALEKDPARRYPTAAALADDLWRHLARRPVLARPASAAHRGRLFVRRHKPLVAGMAAAAAALVAGTVVSGVFAARAAGERAVADRRAADAAAARDDAEARRREARATLYVADVRLAQRAWEDGRVDHLLQLLGEAAAGRPGDPDLRGFEWHYLWRLGHPPADVLTGDPAGVRCLAFSPDGRHLAAGGGGDGTVRLWAVDPGGAARPLRTLPGHVGEVRAVAFSPDGSRVASAGWDGRVLAWDVATGRPLPAPGAGARSAVGVAFAADGESLLIARLPDRVERWGPDADPGRAGADSGADGGDGGEGGGDAAASAPGGTDNWVTALATSADGRRAAAGRVDAGTWRLRAWDVDRAGRPASPAVERSLTGAWVHGVALSPDGRRLATGGSDATVYVWDLSPGDDLSPGRDGDGGGDREAVCPPLALRGHTDWVTAVAFSPDGRRVASAGRDGTVRLWDAASGEPTGVLKGHSNWVMGVAFDTAGRVASASEDGTARVWAADAAGAGFTVLGTGEDALLAVAYAGAGGSGPTADAGRVAVGGRDGTVRLWPADVPGPPVVLRGGGEGVTAVACAPGGRRVASASWDGVVRVWDADGGKAGGGVGGPEGEVSAASAWGEPLALTGHVGRATGVAFDPGGNRLASAGQDGTVRLWSAADARPLAVLAGHAGEVAAIAFAPGGGRVASAGVDGTVRVWSADPAAGTPPLVLRGHAGPVAVVAFSPDGSFVASAGRDQTVRVHDAATGAPRAVLAGHAGTVRAVAFAADGRRLASGADDRTVRVWDPAAGRELLVLRGHAGPVTGVAFAPDGRGIASVGEDRRLIAWPAIAARPAAPTRETK